MSVQALLTCNGNLDGHTCSACSEQIRPKVSCLAMIAGFVLYLVAAGSVMFAAFTLADLVDRVAKLDAKAK